MITAPNARRSTRRIGRAIAVLSMSVLGTSCGIDAQENAQPINPDVLEGLDQTVPPVTDEPGVVPSSPSSTVDTSPSSAPASSLPGPMEDVTLFFIEGPALKPVTVSVQADLGAQQFVERLEEGPPQAEAEAGIRSALPLDLIATVRPLADTVTVGFDPAIFEEVDGRDRPLLIGQIVLTLDAYGIPRVRFMLDGEALPVLRRDGTLTNGTEFVTAFDYEQLVAPDE